VRLNQATRRKRRALEGAAAEAESSAERLGRLGERGRLARARAAAAAAALPGDVRLFVNLHASDLADPDLFDPDSALARIAPRVVLEVTERASLDGIDDVPAQTRGAVLAAVGVGERHDPVPAAQRLARRQRRREVFGVDEVDPRRGAQLRDGPPERVGPGRVQALEVPVEPGHAQEVARQLEGRVALVDHL
jgi:hypothetical protein